MQICARNPLRSALLILALLAVLALSACGSSDDGQSAGPDPATMAPADAALYFEAVVRPEGSQRDDLLSALGKLLNSDDPGAMIRQAVDDGLSEQGFSYADDVEPWLGQQIGAFVTDFSSSSAEGALIVAVTDPGKAEAAVGKLAESGGAAAEDASYEGVTYKAYSDGTAAGIVGDFLVVGTEDGIKAAIDASSSGSLGDDAGASGALADAQQDSLFSVYMDTPRVLDLAVSSGAISRRDLDAAGAQLDALQKGPILLSGASTADSMSIEVSAPASGSEGSSEIVSTLPSEAWLALGLPRIGETIAAGYQSILDGIQSGLSDVPGAALPGGELPDVGGKVKDALGIDLGKDLTWAGDLGAFVRGTSLFDLGAGLVIETDDESAAAATVAKLRQALARQRGFRVTDTADGFRVQSGTVGAEVAVRDGKVVIAIAGVKVDEVLSPPETLAENQDFTDASGALGDDLTPALFIDFPKIVDLVESSGQTAGPSYEQAKPYLDALAYLIAGTTTSDGRYVSRLVLGVQDAASSDAPAASIAP